jgi:hypothetical protein
MASTRRVAAARRATGSKASASRSTSSRGSNYWNYILEFSAKPVVRYVAGGLVIAGLARLAMKMSDRYPEISTFIKDNMDTVESKLQEFTGRSASTDLDDARH